MQSFLSVAEFNQELDDEDALIACSLVSGENLLKIQEWILSPDAFTKLSNREIYKALIYLYTNKQQVNLITIRMHLEGVGLLENIERNGRKLADYLNSGVAFSQENILSWCKSVHDKWIKRELENAALNIIDSCKLPYISAKEILELAEKLVSKTRQDYERPQITEGGYIDELAGQVYVDATTGEGKGTSTGFTDLDERINGLIRGGLISIPGFTGTGKTHFLCELAYNLSVLDDQPCMFLTGEMSCKQIAARLLSRTTAGIKVGKNDKEVGVTSERITIGGEELDDNDWMLLSSALGDLTHKRLYIDWLPGNVDRIPGMLKTFRSQQQDGQLGALFIDYFQLMGCRDVGEEFGKITANRVSELTYISRRLKQIAQEFNIPVIVASQVRRDVEQRKNKRPDLSDVSWSGSLMQDSDVAMFLYRDELYDEDTPDKGILEVIVKKIRASGKLGTVKFFFDPQFSRLRQTEYSF
jgi:replicative DNA helicase